MPTTTADYETLGAFYLGRRYDTGRGAVGDEPVLYDSKDLVTHGVVLGMTGSGKTGLCISLLEEAAIDGIPALVIDPKGDIANLLLTFPEFRAGDFRPWVDEDEARRRGLSPEAFAQQQADLWRDGLADWGQDGARVRTLRESADFTIFTPGSTAGVPVSILSSFGAPGPEVAADAELLGERVEGTVSGILTLLGIDADPIRSREHILLSNILSHTWKAGDGVSLAMLVKAVQEPPFTQVGVVDLESFFPEGDRHALSMRLNNLLAAPGFAAWLEGEPLDVGSLLFTDGGKPRVSIFSIAHLGEAERMFFVSLLLNATVGWMRSQSGTGSLRAIVYMDEVYGYLPPTANPPSKKPMLTMLKQARAFGVGVLLATQNPVDLDYKALSNMGTWFLGRLQTERDQARVLDGLEGAASAGTGRFDRAEMERTLAGLGSRIFLLHNVHEDGPVTFHVRWAMSYLRGPLTRSQIKTLTDARRSTAAAGEAGAAQPVPTPGAAAEAGAAPPSSRPALPKEIDEYFVRTTVPGAELVYLPAVVRAGEAWVKDAKMGIDGLRRAAFYNRLEAGDGLVDWAGRKPLPGGAGALLREPEAGAARYRPLPPLAIKKENYKRFARELEEWFYREGGIQVLFSPTFGLYSNPDEGEARFRVRLGLAAREERDRKVEELRAKYAREEEKIEARVARAAEALEREKAQASSAKVDTALSFGTALFGALLGRKRLSVTNITRGRSAAGRASRAWKESKDTGRAETKLDGLKEELATLEVECREAVDELAASMEAAAREPLETIDETPYKKDIKVTAVGLAWLPYREVGEGDLEEAF